MTLHSYKEASEEETGSDELIEVEETAEAAATTAQKNDAETIERVIRHRMGKKGGEALVQRGHTWQPASVLQHGQWGTWPRALLSVRLSVNMGMFRNE